MTLLDSFVFDTGEIPPRLPDRETVTRQITPPPRRPRLDDSREQPLYAPQTIGLADPASTVRFAAPPLYVRPAGPPKPAKPKADPRRPLFYRGRCRWTRSRAALFAATWPGGAR
jgi:hypothetical protein